MEELPFTFYDYNNNNINSRAHRWRGHCDWKYIATLLVLLILGGAIIAVPLTHSIFTGGSEEDDHDVELMLNNKSIASMHTGNMEILIENHKICNMSAVCTPLKQWEQRNVDMTETLACLLLALCFAYFESSRTFIVFYVEKTKKKEFHSEDKKGSRLEVMCITVV